MKYNFLLKIAGMIAFSLEVILVFFTEEKSIYLKGAIVLCCILSILFFHLAKDGNRKD